MATEEEENFIKLTLLLTKPCRKLMIEVFTKRVHDKYAKCVVTFLNNNRSRILRTKHGKNNEDKYFPPAGQTNLNEWDIVMLYHMITFCHVPSISLHLKSILDMRNELAHPGNVLVSCSDYRKYHTQIQNFIKDGLDYLKDNGLQKDISEDVSRINQMAISKDSVDLLRNLVLYMGKLEQKMDDLERAQELQEQKMDQYGQKLDQYGQKLDQLMSYVKGRHIEPPDDCRALIRLSNCPAEDEDIASVLLVETIRSNDGDRQSNLEIDMVGPLANAYSETCKNMKSATISSADMACVILYLDFKTFADCLEFLHELISNKITEHFRPVQEALRETLSLPNLVLDVIMNTKQFDYCIDYIDEVVQQLIKDNEAAKNNDFECEPQMKSCRTAVDNRRTFECTPDRQKERQNATTRQRKEEVPLTT